MEEHIYIVLKGKAVVTLHKYIVYIVEVDKKVVGSESIEMVII